MKSLRIFHIAHLFGLIWLLCILAFIGYVPSGFNSGTFTDQQNTTLTYIVITGLFAFSGAFFLYIAHYLFFRKKAVLRTSGSHRLLTNPFLLIALFLLLLIGVFSVRGAYNLGSANKALENAQNVAPEVSPVQTDQVNYVDSDPIVSCTVNESCGGGTKQLRQSVCSNSICCQVGNNWVLYEDKNKCIADQSSQNTTNKSNYIPCNVYGQTFNLKPEDCRYYQGQEAGANKDKNDGYVPPYQNYGQSSTPVPTTPQEQYHSSQEACRKSCYATYQNYPDTSLAKQQCVNSCQ